MATDERPTTIAALYDYVNERFDAILDQVDSDRATAPKPTALDAGGTIEQRLAAVERAVMGADWAAERDALTTTPEAKDDDIKV